MSQTLTLELSDEVYAAIQHQAAAVGDSPAHWIATTLEQQYDRLRHGQSAQTRPAEAEKQLARERFERHFGEINLGQAIGSDNEQIDADLAREYATTHIAVLTCVRPFSENQPFGPGVGGHGGPRYNKKGQVVAN